LVPYLIDSSRFDFDKMSVEAAFSPLNKKRNQYFNLIREDWMNVKLTKFVNFYLRTRDVWTSSYILDKSQRCWDANVVFHTPNIEYTQECLEHPVLHIDIQRNNIERKKA